MAVHNDHTALDGRDSMVNLGNAAVAFFIVFIFAVSLLNPGGAAVAAVIAILILAVYCFVPFVQEYVLSVNKGKAARKKPDMPDKQQGGDGRK